jgi:hypothetical protein
MYLRIISLFNSDTASILLNLLTIRAYVKEPSTQSLRSRNNLGGVHGKMGAPRVHIRIALKIMGYFIWHPRVCIVCSCTPPLEIFTRNTEISPKIRRSRNSKYLARNLNGSSTKVETCVNWCHQTVNSRNAMKSRLQLFGVNMALTEIFDILRKGQ